MRRAGACLLVLALSLAGPPAAKPEAEAEAERLRTAKTLFFDRQYVEARQAWQEVLSRSRGAEADSAAYWIARCSESLGELERAFREYGAFLARHPADRTLAGEARTSRLSLAARLVKQGRSEYRPPLLEALQDPGKSVRYFAALQLATLGECGPAGPVLRRIVAEEKDEDLVQRARLGLLRCDPRALAEEAGPSRPRAERPPGASRWLKVRIFERALARPRVSINVPVGLAELLFKSLPEDAREDLRKHGYDADNFWERLKRMPPAEILEIEGDEGERIQIWIE